MAEFDLDLDLDEVSTTPKQNPQPVTTPVVTQVKTAPVSSEKTVNPFKNAAEVENAAVKAKAEQENKRMVSTQKVVTSKASLIVAICSILIALGGIGYGVFLLFFSK